MSTPTEAVPTPETEAARTDTESRTITQMARVAVFYLALVAAAAMTVLFLGELFTLLVVGWTAGAGAELGIHRLHVMGIAVVVLTFVLGLFVQAYRPTRRVAAMWGSFLVILVATAGTLGSASGVPRRSSRSSSSPVSRWSRTPPAGDCSAAGSPTAPRCWRWSPSRPSPCSRSR